MKSNKSYKEAILRAYSTEKENTQDQEHLLSMRQQKKNTLANLHTNETPVVETHSNIMRSWMNLRGLDQHLAAGTNE